MLQQNQKLLALDMSYNSFKGQSLFQISTAFTVNHYLPLLLLKIGRVECSEEIFEDFIRRGVAMTARFRMIHIETNLYTH
jgi:hypothetical protein